MINKFTAAALALAAVAVSDPALAAPPSSTLMTCSSADVSGIGVTFLDCAGLYTGNLVAEDGPKLAEALGIISTEFGVTATSVLDKVDTGSSPVTFAIPLSGKTVVGVHWGLVGTGFYYLDIAGPITQLNIATTFPGATNGGGLSNAGIYSTTPVPEPETYALLLAGLGIVGFMARRRKSA
jgi:hypothetical protein